MKHLLITAFLLGSLYAATAQTNPGNQNPANPSGAPTGTPNGSMNQNGSIPNQYEQNQNRPDSSRSTTDTLNRDQRWNDGSLQKQQNSNKPKSNSNPNNKTTPKNSTGTTPKKKN